MLTQEIKTQPGMMDARRYDKPGKTEFARREARHIKILGTGVSVPARILTHDALDAQLGIPAGSSLKVTGIRSRHVCTTETATGMGAAAGRRALEASGLAWEDVDCIVATSATMDQALPYNAAMIHAELGIPGRRMTFDIGSSCMSFLTGLDVASHLIAAGRFRNVMLVSADIASFSADFRKLKENGIFGDGAAACVLGRADAEESCEILASASITLSEGIGHCQIKACGSRFHRRTPGSNGNALFEMNGKAVFALVARELPGFVENLLGQAGVAMEEIDLVVPHQASHTALRHVVKLLNLDEAKLVDIYPTHGNQVGASLPTALHHGLKHHPVARGSKILLLGSGAGVTIGGMVLVY
jgi:3-oxoacyl-[acyl-carrier-protein] synthase-3